MYYKKIKTTKLIKNFNNYQLDSFSYQIIILYAEVENLKRKTHIK